MVHFGIYLWFLKLVESAYSLELKNPNPNITRFFLLIGPATTANDLRLRRIFYPRLYPLHLFSYLNSWERASIFPFECSVLNKGTTGTIFKTSLVWRGPWLGIEPGTSRTRSQHYTTRLSRRRSIYFKFEYLKMLVMLK